MVFATLAAVLVRADNDVSVINLSCMEHKRNSAAASSEWPFAVSTLVALSFDFSACAMLSTYKTLHLVSG